MSTKRHTLCQVATDDGSAAIEVAISGKSICYRLKTLSASSSEWTREINDLPWPNRSVQQELKSKLKNHPDKNLLDRFAREIN